jgi:predicted ArsR family transcriptional regulator
VVQLAQAVERNGGPGMAEACVAQVAIDVGAQMELEYRAATAVVGNLDPRQLADCFVRLKHAIDGGFHVIEITPDRIVLGNTQCPFGEVVRKAPALCRMTSAVFGGIAANSHGESAVVLDERIAVGDPECRVVIHLGHRADVGASAHRYRGHGPEPGTDTRVTLHPRG